MSVCVPVSPIIRCPMIQLPTILSFSWHSPTVPHLSSSNWWSSDRIGNWNFTLQKIFHNTCIIYQNFTAAIRLIGRGVPALAEECLGGGGAVILWYLSPSISHFRPHKVELKVPRVQTGAEHWAREGNSKLANSITFLRISTESSGNYYILHFGFIKRFQ